MGFIDGTIIALEAESTDFDQWGIVNSMLVAWIYNTLDVSIRSTVSLPDHVQVMWEDLRDRYSLGNGPRVHELKNQIVECKQRGRSVVVYYSELRKLWSELASYNKLPSCSSSAASEYLKLHEEANLHQFLIGLDSRKFGNVVSSLLMMDPLPSINIAYSKIIADERKQGLDDVQEARPDAVGFAVSGEAIGRNGKVVVVSGDTRVCAHCGLKGHEKDKCFELIGWPEWYAGRGSRGGRS